MAATRSPSDSPERLRRPVSSSNVFVEDPEDGERQPFFSPCVEGTTQVLESTTHEMLEDGPEVTQRKCAARWPLLLALAALVMFALWMLRRHIGELVNWLAHLAETSGTWGIVGVICILAVWVVALMPISIFEVLVGHVFPLKTALAVCIAGKTIGACTCFGISQRAKPFVERLMRKHRRLRALARTVQAHPLKATLLVRFSMLPAPIKNYGWSSLGVDFWIFFVATLAEAPMYALPPVLLGGQLSDLADLAAGRQRIPLDPRQLALGLCMLALLVVAGATSQRWLEAEQRATDLPLDAEGEDQLMLRSHAPKRAAPLGAPGDAAAGTGLLTGAELARR